MAIGKLNDAGFQMAGLIDVLGRNTGTGGGRVHVAVRPP